MKFKSYINETIFRSREEADWDFIQNNCRTYFHEAGDTILYRAIQMKEIDFLIKTPRKSRKPKDMPLAISQGMDRFFYKKIGWRPRSTGVFTSTDPNTAKIYGPYVYRIYPISKFRYMYIPRVRDTYTFRSEIETEFHKIHPESVSINNRYVNSFRKKNFVELDPKVQESLEKAVFNILSRKNIKTDGLKGLKDTNTELTISCNKYVMVTTEYYKQMKMLATTESKKNYKFTFSSSS